MSTSTRSSRHGCRAPQRDRRFVAAIVRSLLFACLARTTSVNASAADEPFDFAGKVAPIFAAHCIDCHGLDEAEAGLRLDRPSALAGGDSGEPLVVPGDPRVGRLMQVLSDPESDVVMPPDGERLDDEQLDVLREWIRRGAIWPSDGSDEEEPLPWSFRPLSDPILPATGADEDRGAIDRWLGEGRRARGIVAVEPADRADLLHRAWLVLGGLRPDRDEVARFLNDERPDAFERQVDRLLAGPAFGERWGRHWLDVVRFAETSGFETNVPRNDAWPYRDWVIACFNHDVPVDRFIRDQIAGDRFGVDEATGFLVGGAWDQVKSSDPVLTAMQRQDELADMINTTGTSFLGLTLGCARCHNHKFDPVSQRDYYALQAVFAGVNHGSRPVILDEDPNLRLARTERRRRIAELEDRLASLESPRVPFVPYGTVLIDDRPTDEGAFRLVEPRGEGILTEGNSRGALADPGSPRRLPSLGSPYSWWDNVPDRPVLGYRLPDAAQVRIWCSWGCGWQTHTQHARYELDLDGDLATSDDRRRLATVDQQAFADGTAAPFGATRWSGWLDLGSHPIAADSVLLVVGGGSETAITADAIVVAPLGAADPLATASPPLRAPIASTVNELRFPPVIADAVRMTIDGTNSSEPCLDELEVWSSDGARNVALASAGGIATSSGDLEGYAIHRLEHVNDGRFGNDHSWISNRAGSGMIEIAWPEGAPIDRIVWGRDREGRFPDRTATRWSLEVRSVDGTWIPVADHRSHAPATAVPSPWRSERFGGATVEAADQAERIADELDRLLEVERRDTSTVLTAYAGTFSEPPTIHRLYRGDPMAPREVVEPGAPETLVSTVPLRDLTGATEAERRTELALWLSSTDQALPWRVMANRLWQFAFGRGIVSTPSDFGTNGDPPAHPELLERLAFELRRDRSFKLAIRRMVTSAAFARSGRPDPVAIERDAEAVTLWRYPPRRLEAEAIRDTLLDSAGLLDRRVGGPGYSAFEPNDNYVRNYVPKERFGPETWRRMVYMTKVRMEQDPVFGLFDVPDAGQVCPRRTDSTSPLQALNLLNSNFVLDQSELLAERLADVGATDPQAGVRLAFELILRRAPSDDETADCLELVEAIGWSALPRALWNTNEFLTIP